MLSVVPYQPFDLNDAKPGAGQNIKPYLLTIEYVYLLAQKEQSYDPSCNSFRQHSYQSISSSNN
jgi:hypothetical protein